MSPSTPAPRVPADLLDHVPQQTYKHDARSTVWRAGDFVVKRFNHPRWRQAAAWAVGLHPAQREARRARQLAAAGVPCVPVIDLGHKDGRAYTVTPRRGVSVQCRIAERPHAASAGRLEPSLLDGLARLLRQLESAGWFFRDLQAANIVRDDAGGLHLIDVGSARRGLTDPQRDRMLAMLIRSLRVEGASRTDGLRLLRAARPGADWKPIARRLIALDPRVAELRPTA